MTRREINNNSISQSEARFPEPSNNIERISDLERLVRDTRHDDDIFIHQDRGFDTRRREVSQNILPSTIHRDGSGYLGYTRLSQPEILASATHFPGSGSLKENPIDRIDREIPVHRIDREIPIDRIYLAPILFREPTPQELGQKEKARLLKVLDKYGLIDSLAGSALVLQRTTEELGKLGADTFTWTIDIALQADGLYRYGRIGTGTELHTVTSKPIPVEDYPKYANLADEAIIKYVQAQADK